jgi:hypothetical protein
MVRGAPVTVPILRSNARKASKLCGFYGVSMFAFPDGDADGVAERAGIPHDEICETTAGAIRAEGFELRRTFDRPGHFSLIFDGNPSDEELQRVLELFAECKDNEHKRGG